MKVFGILILGLAILCVSLVSFLILPLAAVALIPVAGMMMLLRAAIVSGYQYWARHHFLASHTSGAFHHGLHRGHHYLHLSGDVNPIYLDWEQVSLEY